MVNLWKCGEFECAYLTPLSGRSWASGKHRHTALAVEKHSLSCQKARDGSWVPSSEKRLGLKGFSDSWASRHYCLAHVPGSESFWEPPKSQVCAH